MRILAKIIPVALGTLLCSCFRTDHPQDAPEGVEAKPGTVALPQRNRPASKASFADMADRVMFYNDRDPTPDLLRLVAAIVDAKAQGVAPMTLIHKELAKDIRFSEFPFDHASACLLHNWSIAITFGLVTPENLDKMRRGEQPVVTIGSFKGQPVIAVRRGEGYGETQIPVEIQLIPASTRQAYLAGGVRPRRPDKIVTPTPKLVMREVPMSRKHNSGMALIVEAAPGSSPTPRPTRPPSPQPGGMPMRSLMPPGAGMAGAPKASPTPYDEYAHPKFTWTVDASFGVPLDLGSYGLSQQELIVRNADRTSGVRVSVIDNSNSAKVEKKTFTYDSDGIRHAGTSHMVSMARTFTSPLRGDPIPKTTLTGTKIWTSYPVAIYVTDGISFPGRCQLVIQRAGDLTDRSK